MKNIPFYILAVASLVIIALVLKQQTDESNEFELKKDESQLMAAVSSGKYLVKPEQLAGWLAAPEEEFILVDIRNPQNFQAGHIENAVNIPFQKILDNEWYAFFLDTTMKKVLYCDLDIYSAEAMMLLHQLGCTNIYVLEGGMNFWKSNMLDNYNPLSGASNDETPHYNYKALMSAGGSGSAASVQPAAGNTPQLPVNSGKKPAVKGSCG